MDIRFLLKRDFAIDKSEWTTLANVNQMYVIIYDEMVDCKALEENVCVYNDKYRKLDCEEFRFEKMAQNSLIHKIICLPAKLIATHA